MATSCFTPVMSSLVRICMGCDISTRNPSTSLIASSIFSESSACVLALVHSLLGLSCIIMSPRSIGMGSVGISELPMRVTTCFTSGKRFFSIFSASVVLAIILDRLVPCFMLTSAQRSPSSKLGINSPPMREKINKATASRAIPVATMALLYLRLTRSNGK